MIEIDYIYPEIFLILSLLILLVLGVFKKMATTIKKITAICF